jgi:trk system potassium uptake protein TrkH
VSGGTKRPRQRSFIRRGVRQPKTVELPPLPEPPSLPHPGRHAQTFILALTLIIVGGTALLASPWTTESGRTTPLIDAFFTAISAVAVTGLVTVDTATHWNFLGELIILVLIQIGGLGFMVGTSIVLQVLRRGSTRLSDALLVRESSPTLSLRDAIQLSRQIALFTIATEVVGALFLTLRFSRDMPLFDALWFGIFHAVSAFCNAGFDLQEGGFVSFIPYQDSLVINGVVMLLVQAGALSYLAFADVVSARRWRWLAVDTKLILTVNGLLVAAGTIAFLAIEWNGALASTVNGIKPMVALFQSVAGRTAGYATVSFGDVTAETLFIWMALMLIGGASGSTAGGVKLATVGVIAAALLSTLQGRDETQVFGRRVPVRIVFQAMAVIAIMLTLHFVATALLVASQGWFQGEEFPFVTLMFEAMSALATVGLSTGITPSLETAGKLILCVLMFVGRLGPLTVVYALQRRRRPVRLRYATASVRIG